VDGQGGDDTLAGGTGNDNLDGGEGFDLAVLASAAGVSVNLETGQAAGEGKDTLAHIEAAQGGAGNDTLVGDGGANLLAGDGGNDRLIGAGGDDTLVGGAGNDLLDGGGGLDLAVFDVPGGIYVDLGLGLATVEGDDTLIGVEGVQGGAGNDTLIGDGNANLLLGAGGDDLLVGGTGDDTLDGGAGTDVAAFAGKIADYEIANSAGIITVTDLNPLVDGNDGADTLTTVEQLRFADGVVVVSLDLALLTPAQGSVIYGVDEFDRSGISVSSAGDVNGDGFDDLIVGAYAAGAADNAKFLAGESYVIFGGGAGFGTSLDLAALTPAQGFVIFGADAYDNSGRSVACAGDVNGDGFDDLIVGAPRADTAGNAKPYAGESYVIFGTDTGFGASLDLAALTPAQGFVIFGADAYDQAGISVSSAGDVNGDGFDDLIVGAYGGDAAGNAKSNAGESYVIFGSGAGFGASIDLAALTPAQGFVIVGADTYDSIFGISVSSAGDVNGDGFDDLIVGAPGADAAGNAKSYAGESYVVFGSGAGFGASIDLAALTPAQGFVIFGADAGDNSGFSVSSAGDVNGDGFDDLINGAFGGDAVGDAKSYAGESYVIFGSGTGFGASIDLAALTPAQGFVILGADAGDFAGGSVSSAGDVNGDGFDDLIVGAGGGDAAGDAKSDAGESYVIFGTDTGFGLSLDLATLTPSQGFVIYGADAYDGSGGIAVSAAGDVNGDGFDDWTIGAPFADAAGNAKESAGESYVIYGGDFNGGVVFAGTSGADNLIGTAAAEIFVGGQANDTLVGNGGADAFQGGEGDDTIAVASVDFLLVDGASGTDTLRLDGAGFALDLTTLADNHTRSIEQIDITGNGDNTLTVSVLDVLNLSDESNQLLVDGDAGDTVARGAGWTAGGTTVVDGQTYQIYTGGAASLLVDTDVVTTV
jgi:hypothetical protein